MLPLYFSPRANRDLLRLHRFLKKEDAALASRAIRQIRLRLKVLQDHPQIGRLLEADEEHATHADFREWVIDFGSAGYVALYRIDARQVTVIAVRHQREAGYEP